MKKDVSAIKFKCMNVGGIGSKEDKRHTVFNSVKNTWDITILTETKFKADQIKKLDKEWDGKGVHSVTPSLTARAGVSILFKRGLAFEFHQGGSDGQGRIVWAEISMNSKKFLVVGVYAPSDKDDPLFFEKLFGTLEGRNYDHVVISGDFNVGLDEKLDYMGYTGKAPRPKSRETIKKFLKQYGMSDIYRDRNPSSVQNTWQKRDKTQANEVKQARLDYFLIDNELGSFVELAGPAEPFNKQFDHRAVLLKVDLSKVQRGPGYWKMNNALLDDLEYVDLVHNTIIKVIHTYQSVRPGEKPLSKAQIEGLPPEERGYIKMTLNPHQFLEFLLFSIKGVTRKYGAKRKQSLVSRVEQLEADLHELTGIIDAANKATVRERCNYKPEEEQAVVEAIIQAGAKQKEKERLQDHINHGAYVRTGQHWKCESEAGSKLFFQQERWRGDQRYIGVLEVDAGKEDGSIKLIESQPEIEKEVHRFYKDLYKERPTKSSKEDIKKYMGEGYESFENILGKKLPSKDQEKLEEPISQSEVMQALMKGQHGKAPGITGFSREFYKTFASALIGPIMAYIKFTEESGQISDQHRQGVITLLPKGKKCKRDLRNWRPITLLTTLYKIISGTIAERVKGILPHIIGEDQKGFVDGRYMGEVTRTLYDTIHDAWTYDKKGVLLSIDFEKAFDSLSHDFIKAVMEIAGFGSMLKRWIKILLNKFSSRVNHVGNLLTAIDLGRGARQGDPIASLLFVLCIEILLIAIRTNPKVEPYTYFKRLTDKETITSKAEAFADDVTLTLPYKESSLREAVATIDKFGDISGLTINQGKTQVMLIGKNLKNSATLAPDLGLNWVNEIKILGVKLYANPEQMLSNFDDKVDDIKQLLNRWTFRNLTVYARIQIVKSLGLSKMTHLIQIVPNPPPTMINDLQRQINKFVWEGGKQKKHVVNEGRAQQPPAKGGLGVPNVKDFWNGLKCTWIHRLLQAPETAKWKKLALRDLRGALRKPTLDASNIMLESPQKISRASMILSNKFWAPIWQMLPTLNDAYNKKNNESHYLHERLIWGTSSFLNKAGVALDPKNYEPEVVATFRTVGEVVDTGLETGRSQEARARLADKLSVKSLGQFLELFTSINEYLMRSSKTFSDVTRHSQGPYHLGWSRLSSEISKSREACRLIQHEKHYNGERNENEEKWRAVNGIQTMTSLRWDKVYKNLSLMRCNLRIRYQEWRIAWGRQELNRDRSHYSAFTNQVTTCSYCNSGTETEFHLYVSCRRLELFWMEARIWTYRNLGVKAPINLKCHRLFGMESEKPDTIHNMFYRNVRYTIFIGRDSRHHPNIDYFEGLMLEDLRRKYAGTKISKYSDNAEEQLAISWYKQQLSENSLTAVN